MLSVALGTYPAWEKTQLSQPVRAKDILNSYMDTVSLFSMVFICWRRHALDQGGHVERRVVGG